MSNKRISSVIALGICMFMLAGCNITVNVPEAPVQEGENHAAEETGEYKTDLFEITIPDDLRGIVDVEVSSDRIDIYHKESKDGGFGGLEFAIWAVSVPREYAGGPYTKIGELNGRWQYI